MENLIQSVLRDMIAYEGNCPERVQHFLKVHNFAKSIAYQEGLDKGTSDILEITALMHDIGIKPALEKYGSDAGPYQEKEGIEPAKALLAKYELSQGALERILFMISHHHSYNEIDAVDFQILVEADFLVNIYENRMSEKQIQSIKERIFKTGTGLSYISSLYL